MDKKVLLVEDDLFLRQLYTDLLVNEKYQVETAADGDEGYTKMKVGGWDLVLLDMMMPGLNGLEVIKKIKVDLPNLQIKKIVFLTNTDNPQDIEQIKANSDGYLLKSNLNPEEFIGKVQNFL